MHAIGFFIAIVLCNNIHTTFSLMIQLFASSALQATSTCLLVLYTLYTQCIAFVICHMYMHPMKLPIMLLSNATFYPLLCPIANYAPFLT